MERPGLAAQLKSGRDKGQGRTRSSSPAPSRSEAARRLKSEEAQSSRSRSSESAGSSRRARSRSPSPKPKEPKSGNLFSLLKEKFLEIHFVRILSSLFSLQTARSCGLFILSKTKIDIDKM